jgi:hypothetical protein
MTPEKAKNIYWGAMPLPPGAKSLGEYTSLGKRGCLIELANGNRVVGNAGVIRSVKGGAMPGAGAPKKPDWLKKRQIGLQLPDWIIDKLDNLPESRSTEIETALIDKYGWKPPYKMS